MQEVGVIVGILNFNEGATVVVGDTVVDRAVVGRADACDKDGVKVGEGD